ncbi:unnamed protein product, partial [Discosporangium mesarthrocarpum]
MSSKAYCDHLHSQLKGWESAFRSRHGRFPSRKDFDDLENEETMRSKVVYKAFVEYNKATNNSFTKELDARGKARSVTVVGGPRRQTKETRNAKNGSGELNSGSAVQTVKSRRKAQADHDAIMELLRPQVEQRVGHVVPGNKVLAARNGYQSMKDKPKAKNRFLGTTGVSVSIRARAMSAKAETMPGKPTRRGTGSDRREEAIMRPRLGKQVIQGNAGDGLEQLEEQGLGLGQGVEGPDVVATRGDQEDVDRRYDRNTPEKDAAMRSNADNQPTPERPVRVRSFEERKKVGMTLSKDMRGATAQRSVPSVAASNPHRRRGTLGSPVGMTSPCVGGGGLL